MSRAPKSSGGVGARGVSGTGATDWRPSASLDALRRRAEMLAAIRRFFAGREVMEVETPVLSAYGVTDPQIESFRLDDPPLYLQTSPEYAMKRLLAAGSGPIYQVSRVFRAGEDGRRHNREFTLLEWYRPGFDQHALMGELDELVRRLLGTRPAVAVTYRQAFMDTLGVDPMRAAEEALHALCVRDGLDADASRAGDRDMRLDYLFGRCIVPGLGAKQPVFVHDFPASQASLARLDPDDPTVARRFELVIDGMEVANGFHELADAGEQRRRFERDQAGRAGNGQAEMAVDPRLLAALEAGIGDCAGVAVGLDRLLMLKTGADSLREVMAFPGDLA